MSMRSRVEFPRGFSLVELLVVVAIIAVLAALLAPAVLGARAKGHDAACRSNLRQHYSAFLHYASDHDNQLPGYVNPPWPGAPCNDQTWVIWQTTLIKEGYLAGWSEGARGFVALGLGCPVNINGYYTSSEKSTYRSPGYLYNTGMGIDPSCAGNSNPPPKKVLSSVENPSKKGLLFEGGQLYGAAAFRSGYAIEGWTGYFDTNLLTYSIADVHGNRSNVLMLDGHVESFERGKIDWKIAALDLP